MSKVFPLGDILTITTGRLVAEDGMVAIYRILDYLTQDKLMTHQLPRASDECKPWLLQWHPELAVASTETDALDNLTEDVKNSGEACRLWVAYVRTKCGLPESLELEPIPQDDHERKDPYDELVAMRGTDEGIFILSSRQGKSR